MIFYRGFKALKQQTKLLFLVLRRPHDALKTYTELLTYTKSAVTRNYSEKSINGILDYVGDGGKKGKGRKVAAAAAANEIDVDVLQKFYEVTKASLEDSKNDASPFFLCQRCMPTNPRKHIAPIAQNQP